MNPMNHASLTYCIDIPSSHPMVDPLIHTLMLTLTLLVMVMDVVGVSAALCCQLRIGHPS